MESTINNNQDHSNQSNIMKELSDIKTSLAVNTNETQTIKESVNEVKGDVKEMKKNYITQEQHKELVVCKDDHEIRIRDTEKNITKIMTFGSIFVILIGVAEFLINQFYSK